MRFHFFTSYADFTKKYFELFAEIKKSLKENAPKGKWLY